MSDHNDHPQSFSSFTSQPGVDPCCAPEHGGPLGAGGDHAEQHTPGRAGSPEPTGEPADAVELEAFLKTTLHSLPSAYTDDELKYHLNRLGVAIGAFYGGLLIAGVGSTEAYAFTESLIDSMVGTSLKLNS